MPAEDPASMTTPSICLCGAAPDTGNLGVSALAYATLGALARRLPRLSVTVFDHQRGVRPFRPVVGGRALDGARAGLALTRRLHRPESVGRLLALARLGLYLDEPARRVRDARAVLDISGGDSFSDIYGAWRFRAVTAPKRLALRARSPLVLLPQTYGPFASPRARRTAERIVRAAHSAWARDARSFDTLRDLAGDRFDPARHRAGVDVAFLLETLEPGADTLDALPGWFTQRDGSVVAGLNVSGLVWNDPGAARERFGLACDYRAALVAMCGEILKTPGARLLLVPHVVTPPGQRESDPAACAELAEQIGAPGRVAVAPAVDDPRHAKWIISRCDWFCGTRMHATIAALSSGVPTSTLAYSLKARGVFESCAQGEQVADMRTLDAGAAAARALASLRDRAGVRASLERALPAVMGTANDQFDAVADAIDPSWRSGAAPAPARAEALGCAAK